MTLVHGGEKIQYQIKKINKREKGHGVKDESGSLYVYIGKWKGLVFKGCPVHID